MKQNKIYTLIVLSLLFYFFSVSFASAQPGYCVGDYYITNQAELDALIGDNCTEISGTLVIDSPSLENLNGLENLGRAFGLTIKDCTALTDLSGLQGLYRIGWDLWIINNTALTSLEGLNNIQDIYGDQLLIAGNDNLNNIEALHGDEYTGDDMDLHGNYLAIFANPMLTMEAANTLVDKISPPDGIFNGTAVISNNGTGLVDTDGDGIPDIDDNCPDNCNAQQLDADDDDIGDVCDPDPGCSGCGTPCEVEC